MHPVLIAPLSTNALTETQQESEVNSSSTCMWRDLAEGTDVTTNWQESLYSNLALQACEGCLSCLGKGKGGVTWISNTDRVWEIGETASIDFTDIQALEVLYNHKGILLTCNLG